jgi:hypothetical protein
MTSADRYVMSPLVELASDVDALYASSKLLIACRLFQDREFIKQFSWGRADQLCMGSINTPVRIVIPLTRPVKISAEGLCAW